MTYVQAIMYSLHATNTTKNNTLCMLYNIHIYRVNLGTSIKESAKVKHLLEVMNSLQNLYFKIFYLDKYCRKQNRNKYVLKFVSESRKKKA